MIPFLGWFAGQLMAVPILAGTAIVLLPPVYLVSLLKSRNR